jgi:hypothetical protein
MVASVAEIIRLDSATEKDKVALRELRSCSVGVALVIIALGLALNYPVAYLFFASRIPQYEYSNMAQVSDRYAGRDIGVRTSSTYSSRNWAGLPARVFHLHG